MTPHLGDTFLAWASSERHGSITRLRDKLLWFARTRDINLSTDDAGSWVRLMAALGHLEVDWKAGRWAVVPPTVTMLPAADGTALVTGALAFSVLAHQDIEPVLRTLPRDVAPIPGLLPQLRLLQVDDSLAMQQTCAEVGLVWADYGAVHLSDRLSELGMTERTAPPARDAPLEFLAVALPRRWRPSSVYDSERHPGLYRTTVGEPRYYYRSEGSWWHTELAEGLAVHLTRSGEQYLSWRAEADNSRRHVGSLLVDSRAFLPPLHERAAVLCSGLTPVRRDQSVEYRNVSRHLAQKIASSVGQNLRIARSANREVAASV